MAITRSQSVRESINTVVGVHDSSNVEQAIDPSERRNRLFNNLFCGTCVCKIHTDELELL